MLKDVVKGKTWNPLNEAEKEYIRNNHHNTSGKDMALFLHRRVTMIYDFMETEGLSVYRKYKYKATQLQDSGYFNEMAKNNWLIN